MATDVKNTETVKSTTGFDIKTYADRLSKILNRNSTVPAKNTNRAYYKLNLSKEETPIKEAK